MENKNDFKQNDYQSSNNQNGNWQSSNYQNGNNQNGNWHSSNYQSSNYQSGNRQSGNYQNGNYQNSNYQGNNGNYNRNSEDLGENIKSFVQETLDAIDYGGLGAKINRAVNDGIEQIRKQVEQGKRQGGSYNGNNYNGAYNGQPNGGQSYRNQSYEGQNYRSRNYGGQAYRAQQNYREQPYMEKSRSKRSSKRDTELYPANIVTHYPAGRVSGILLQVFGGIGFAGSLVTSIVFGSLFFAGFGKFTVVALGITLPLFLMSIIMIKSGSSMHKRVKRFYEYVRLFAGRRYCDIKLLGEKTGKSSKFILKDLKKMIKKGMFPQACLDDEGKTLILDHEVYDEYIEMKKGQEEAAKAKEHEKDISEMTDEERLIEEGKLYLKQIKEANDAIPGEEISQKLERLEIITGKIFSYVASHPEKVPETRKFMDYYMPTTLKLVCAYKEFDAQDIQGDTIKTAKDEIEHSLDMVNEAFENLFDSLFQDEAMDISSDISVLKTMLKQEGLMGSDFRKEKKDE